jgi:hypothetical protein
VILRPGFHFQQAEFGKLSVNDKFSKRETVPGLEL